MALPRGAYGLPLDLAELKLCQEVAGGRNPPTKPVRELVACVGRGGGKDSVAAALAIFIAVTADTSHLRAGEYATVFTFAVDRDQAAIAYDYIKAFFENVPLLKGMVKVLQGRFANEAECMAAFGIKQGDALKRLFGTARDLARAMGLDSAFVDTGPRG